MPVLIPSPSAPVVTTADEVTVVLGDIVLPGNRVNAGPDEYGVKWGLTGISGWFQQAESTGRIDPRAADHGGWLSSAYYASRVVEIEGRLTAPSIGEALAALQRVAEAIPLDTPDLLYVTAIDQTLQAAVREQGPLLHDELGDAARGRITFSLSLVAADPRRYAVDETTASTGLPATSGGMVLPLTLPLTVGATVTAGVLSLTNAGNMASPWVGTVTGPVSAGASITHRGSGKTLRIAADVAAGRVLTIDSDRRRALLDGTAARVVTGSWFDLAPGSNDIAFSAPTASAGTLGFTFRSAWK